MSSFKCTENHLDSGTTETVGTQENVVDALEHQLVEHHVMVVVLCVVEEQDRVCPPVGVLSAKFGNEVTYKDQEDLAIDVCLQNCPVKPTVVVNGSNHGEPGCDILAT